MRAPKATKIVVILQIYVKPGFMYMLSHMSTNNTLSLGYVTVLHKLYSYKI